LAHLPKNFVANIVNWFVKLSRATDSIGSCCGTDSATTTAPPTTSREVSRKFSVRIDARDHAAVDQGYFDGFAADGLRCGLGRILKRN
jgi:homoserine acetyltransferase